MLLLDAHVHVYPHHDPARLLAALGENLRAALPGVQPEPLAALALTERAGVDLFSAWRRGARLPAGSAVEPLDETLLRLAIPGGGGCLALAGRQIACRERVEILALGLREALPDGIAAAQAVEAVLAAGGLPVLAWGVGKWWFGRAAVVRRLLARFPPSQLLLGDTALRPVLWPEPPPMRRARLAGRKVLAGSDPLSAAGEERMAGRYATLLRAQPPVTGPTTDWLLGALRDPAVAAQSVGRRNSTGEFLRRMRKG